MYSRAPRGARGLKREGRIMTARPRAPRPARGAWIETPLTPRRYRRTRCRAPRGARGLKHARTDARRAWWAAAPRAGRVD